MMSRFIAKAHVAVTSLTAQPSNWSRIAIWFASIAILVVFTATAGAQDNASITGTVSDPSGAAVVNASITITNVATGQVRHTVSNSSGDFLLANLGAGQYNLEAAAPGFQKFTRTGIRVDVARTLEENVSFQVGNTQQSVTVEADAIQVQSETNEVSSLISGQQVTEFKQMVGDQRAQRHGSRRSRNGEI